MGQEVARWRVVKLLDLIHELPPDSRWQAVANNNPYLVEETVKAYREYRKAHPDMTSDDEEHKRSTVGYTVTNRQLDEFYYLFNLYAHRNSKDKPEPPVVPSTLRDRELERVTREADAVVKRKKSNELWNLFSASESGDTDTN